MKERIITVLDNIYSSLQSRDPNYLSILQGEAGYCLFQKLYVQYFDQNLITDFQSNLQVLAENSIGRSYPTFADGKPGINWFFSYLKKDDILSPEDWELLCDDDPKWTETALNFLAEGHYDFLHGAIGIAYHLLYSRGNKGAYKTFFTNFFSVLESIGKYNDGLLFFPDYDRSKKQIMPDKINFGLAHGIPSIIKFCVQCYKQNVCAVQAKNISYQLIEILKKFVNKDRFVYSFPTYISLDGDYTEDSRLAWCYGDLGVAIILYQAAVVFDDIALNDFAQQVLLHTTTIKNKITACINDADVCHGAAGVAYIYYKMWHYTKNSAYKEACDYWMNETLNMATYSDGLAGYKSFLPYLKSYKNSYTLLDGACGIGLVMLSYLTEDFSWDYCLMLND